VFNPAAAPSPSAAASAARPTPLSPRAALKISLNPAIITYLPLLLAQEKGYFSQAGLDIDLQTYQGSANTQLPLLARGDLDLTGAAPGPALFNQLEQGFNARVVAGMSLPRAGRLNDSWLTVLKDRSSEIKQPGDLKGKTVDGAAEGSPLHLLAAEAIRQGGLTAGQDVTISFRGRTVPDQVALAKAKGADVIAIVEPAASQSEAAGDVVRWLSYPELAPWYQSLTLAASDGALQRNSAAIQKFLEVYVLACREINAANGQWSAELAGVATKYAGVDASIIRAQGGVPYYDPNGTPSAESLQKTQEIWVREKQVRSPVDLQRLVDDQLLQKALAAIGRAN
jgi:ABC-type nitrate/sulfonate/bicarbonate transport system substrate-binding protein